MLKIKDNVDLKELEKFGFRLTLDHYYLEMYDTYIYVDVPDRHIEFDAGGGFNRDEGTDILDAFFNLCQAGFVENTKYEDQYWQNFFAELKQSMIKKGVNKK